MVENGSVAYSKKTRSSCLAQLQSVWITPYCVELTEIESQFARIALVPGVGWWFVSKLLAAAAY